MAVICRNCGGTLVFDPESQKMICNRCGAFITPGEVEFYARDILEDKKVIPLSKIMGAEPYDDLPVRYSDQDEESADDSEDETDAPVSLLRDPDEIRKDAEEYPDYELEDPPPLLKDIPGPIRNFAKRNFAKWDFSDNYMECAVYTCDYCGGEVIVNGTEA